MFRCDHAEGEPFTHTVDERDRPLNSLVILDFAATVDERVVFRALESIGLSDSPHCCPMGQTSGYSFRRRFWFGILSTCVTWRTRKRLTMPDCAHTSQLRRTSGPDRLVQSMLARDGREPLEQGPC